MGQDGRATIGAAIHFQGAQLPSIRSRRECRQQWLVSRHRQAETVRRQFADAGNEVFVEGFAAERRRVRIAPLAQEPGIRSHALFDDSREGLVGMLPAGHQKNSGTGADGEFHGPRTAPLEGIHAVPPTGETDEGRLVGRRHAGLDPFGGDAAGINLAPVDPLHAPHRGREKTAPEDVGPSSGELDLIGLDGDRSQSLSWAALVRREAWGCGWARRGVQ